MTITVGNSTNGTGGTVTKPSGAATGDTVVALVGASGSGVAIPGFTNQIEITGLVYTVALLTRVLDGSEGASWTATSGATVSVNGALVLTPSAGNTLAIDGTPTSNSAGNGSTATCGAITTSVANTILIAGFASSSTGHSTPTGMTEVFDTSGGATGLSLDYQAIAAAGSTGTRASTTGGIRMVGVMLALKETTASSPATVNAVVATESSAAPTATIKAASRVTGVVATESALMPVPTPKAASKVTGVVSTMSAQAYAPTVGVFTTVTVNAVVATENSVALAPTLKTAARVTGVAATLSAQMPVPTITGQRPATVAAITATEQALMPVPSVLVKMRVIGVVATESAQMFAPSIGIPVRVTVPAAAVMNAQSLAPVVTSKASILAPAATLALSASLPSIAIGFTPPELVTTMPNKAHTLTWADGAWPDLSQALVGVTVSPGFESLVFDAYVQDNTTVVLDLSASDAATLNAGRIAPYQMTADFDDRRALVLAQGLFVATIPGVVMDGDALRNPRAITQGTAATLTWSDPMWPALDHVLVTVVVGAGRNERRYEAAIDAGDVVTLNLTATGAQLDPGVYSYEVRADFDTTGLYQLATGLLAVNAA